MMRKIAATLCVALACAALAGPSYGAGCNASISKIGSINAIDYDPFDGVARSVTFTVEFQNNGSDSCTVGVAVGRQASDPQRAFTNPGGSLIYAVKLPGGSEIANTLLSPAGNLTLPGGSGKHATLTLKLEVPAALIAPAGNYSDVLIFRGYDLGGHVALSGDRTATAYASVDSRAEINLAGASGSFGVPFALDKLDFGVLATGAEKNAFVQVRATSPVTITVTSQNRGKLFHTTLKQHAPGVAYALTLDAQAVNLASGSFSLDRNPPVTLDGVSYPMNVRIGNVTGVPAGQYQDVLTVSVCPR